MRENTWIENVFYTQKYPGYLCHLEFIDDEMDSLSFP